MPTRVLVVEDDDVIRQLITVNLELEGFEVVTAVDGQDALDRIGDIRPDVVTLDVMMPRLDGWQTASRLRENPDTAHIKVVLLSARAQEADIQHGERLGVDAYLTKPFDPEELVTLIRILAGDDA
ncbi:MAG TPA: response regulator [Mycobacteriales bacterium]|nr:response regulator [Mycobacteriales bacterium]